MNLVPVSGGVIKLMTLRILKIYALSFIFSITAYADLKIGFIGGFSGQGELFGDACRNGFELAKEEATELHLKVIYEDSQFSLAKTVSAFHKLARVEKVDLIIVLGSPASAVASLAESRRMPVIAWAGDPTVSLGRKWIVRAWVSAEAEGKELATLVRDTKVKNPAVIVSDDDYSGAFIRGFKHAFQGPQVDLGVVAGSEMDFRSLLLRAKTNKADAMVICLGVGQSAAVARQAHNLGMPVPIFGCETLNTAEEIRLAQGTLRGARFTAVIPQGAFVERYEKKFGPSGSIGGSAIHYELFRLFNEIAAQTDHSTVLMQRILTTTNRPSVLGPLTIVNQGGDQHFDLPIGIYEIPAISNPRHFISATARNTKLSLLKMKKKQ